MGHHFVPQAYLNGFCEPSSPGILWQYDKRRDQFSQASVKKIAQQAEFYPPAVEVQLNELVECPANLVLQKLRTGQPIDRTDRVPLAVYIATMMKRVPRHRQKALDMAPQVLEDTVRELKEQIEALGRGNEVDPTAVASRLAEVDAVSEKFRKRLPADVLDQVYLPWPSAEVVGLIFSMTWRFLSTEGPSYFLTSDNPACFFEGYGLGKSESELTLPISSNLALLGSWQPGTVRVAVSRNQQLVKEVNRRVAASAARFLFYRARKEWVAALGRKKEHYLSRIQW